MFRLGMAVLVVGFLCGCGSAAPGRAIDWNAVGTSSPGSTPVRIAIATPSPSVAVSGSGGWGAVWQNLNSNTAEVARGQYGILGELERTAGDYVNGMLQSVH